MPNKSRKVRGRRTELVVATYFQQFWGRAEAVSSGASGSDIKHLPFDVEVKARAKFDPLAFIKQLKMLGNGVVPQQAYLALELLTNGNQFS